MLSIIIPTFQSHESLDQAINSVQAQTVADWEIVISPDDGLDYSYLQARDARIRVVQSGAVATGAAQARNRALAHVSGTAVAYLDDDDQITESYVADALAALTTRPSILFPTQYVADGETIRTVGRTSAITIADFSQELGSLHVVARRDSFPTWYDYFAEDVVHTCEVIDQQGGSIDVIPSAQYIATLRNNSTCQTQVLNAIDTQYQALLALPLNNMTPLGREAFQNLIQYRRHINQLYEQSGQTQNYHAFVRQLTTNDKHSIITF